MYGFAALSFTVSVNADILSSHVIIMIASEVMSCMLPLIARLLWFLFGKNEFQNKPSSPSQTFSVETVQNHVVELPKLPKELKEDSDEILLWAKFINAEKKEDFAQS